MLEEPLTPGFPLSPCEGVDSKTWGTEAWGGGGQEPGATGLFWTAKIQPWWALWTSLSGEPMYRRTGGRHSGQGWAQVTPQVCEGG